MGSFHVLRDLSTAPTHLDRSHHLRHLLQVVQRRGLASEQSAIRSPASTARVRSGAWPTVVAWAFVSPPFRPSAFRPSPVCRYFIFETVSFNCCGYRVKLTVRNESRLVKGENIIEWTSKEGSGDVGVRRHLPRGMSLSRGDDFRPPSMPVPGLQHRRPNFLTPPNAGPGMRARSHSPLSPPPFREGPAYHQQIHQSQSLQMTQQSNRPQQISRSYSPQPSGRPRRARQQGGGNGRASTKGPNQFKCSVYVSHIPSHATWHDVQTAMASQIAPTQRVYMQPRTSWAHVYFYNIESTELAVRAANSPKGVLICGQPVKIERRTRRKRGDRGERNRARAGAQNRTFAQSFPRALRREDDAAGRAYTSDGLSFDAKVMHSARGGNASVPPAANTYRRAAEPGFGAYASQYSRGVSADRGTRIYSDMWPGGQFDARDSKIGLQRYSRPQGFPSRLLTSSAPPVNQDGARLAAATTAPFGRPSSSLTPPTRATQGQQVSVSAARLPPTLLGGGGGGAISPPAVESQGRAAPELERYMKRLQIDTSRPQPATLSLRSTYPSTSTLQSLPPAPTAPSRFTAPFQTNVATPATSANASFANGTFANKWTSGGSPTRLWASQFSDAGASGSSFFSGPSAPAPAQSRLSSSPPA